jgi:hypothetical protein
MQPEPHAHTAGFNTSNSHSMRLCAAPNHDSSTGSKADLICFARAQRLLKTASLLPEHPPQNAVMTRNGSGQPTVLLPCGHEGRGAACSTIVLHEVLTPSGKAQAQMFDITNQF